MSLPHHDADPPRGSSAGPPADASADPDIARFNELWASCSSRVLAYATRHVGRDDAQEALAETFLVAWRRLADVPEQPLPWLLVVARNTMANQRRSAYRRTALHSELAHLHASAAPAAAADVTVGQRADVLAVLAALSPSEREALLLVSWDGLSVPEAARVAGCSTSAMHVRLFRARRRLRASSLEPIGDDDEGRPAVTAPPRQQRATNRTPATAPATVTTSARSPR
ncbi:RNA polymerase sigma-70 factor, ECF subfamily [Quadrisphaera granulorum]|uniref:RNA polymerase sigma-70 factor (ECF subfamily) n=1 Tax=Quadrisphaera granulorum TaxID=317664 RepID=A0A316ACE3_9ACTN|nr:sigma-70 family RNA polymerase sigma factor [Quadrisphaera granulorum]PWJ54564.1 RNA polymerase sigma-70 factor (ECF subfamily) [Quadrisphaera granulorum]SZE95926.1 RNA polymerase sigma-70 factor, ECF subfamily [Quadrisphaera granulorum]